MAASRIPATNARSCSSPASGPATASSSAAITCQPSRLRAYVIAAGLGCIPASARTRNRLAHSRPATSLFHTSP